MKHHKKMRRQKRGREVRRKRKREIEIDRRRGTGKEKKREKERCTYEFLTALKVTVQILS